jgi:FAD/FMN-containing dehydrogenase
MTVDHVLEMKVILDDGSPAHFRALDGEQLRWHTQQSNREAAIYRQVSNLVYDERNRGAIRRGTPRHWRRCGGYNLARFIHDGSIDHYLPQDERFNLVNLLAGAEGTLAAITELKLKVAPRPQRTALVIVEFPSLITSLQAVTAILETGPSAVELIDDLSLEMARTKPEYDRLLRSFVQGEPFCFLAVEYYGASEAELRSRTDDLMARLRRSPLTVGPMTPLLDSARQANVWSLRKVGLGLLMSVRGEWKPLPFIEDTAVPPEHLAAYIPRIEAFCRDLGVRMTYYAHASAGCLHIRPLINVKQAAEVEKMRAITQFTAELLGAYGGALSSEHGDGRVRSWLNQAFYGPDLYRLFQGGQGGVRPAEPLQPRQHRRRAGAGRAAAQRPRLPDDSVDHETPLRRRLCDRSGDVQRRRGLPQTGQRRHVPQLHGDARGGAQHPRSRQPAARRARRLASSRRTHQPAHVRSDGTLRKLQNLQSRMPVVGGHGAAQNRISGAVL